jgi:hypothetical protein
VSHLRRSNTFCSVPTLPASLRSPSVWANLLSRLRRLEFRVCHGVVSQGGVTGGKSCVADAMRQRSRSLTFCGFSEPRRSKFGMAHRGRKSWWNSLRRFCGERLSGSFDLPLRMCACPHILWLAIRSSGWQFEGESLYRRHKCLLHPLDVEINSQAATNPMIAAQRMITFFILSLDTACNPAVTLFSQCIHPFDVSSRWCYGRKS